MKTTIFRSSLILTLVAGAQVAPARLLAQRADSTRNHIVKPGDTLWALAATMLGDGNRWREILALNPSLGNRSTLTVGTTLRIPPVKSTAKNAPAATAKAPTTDTGRRTTQRPYITDTIKRTIFFGAQPAGGFIRDPMRRSSTDSGVPARIFEGVSAPFVADEANLDRGGHCVSVGPTGAAEAGGVLLHGTLEVQLPAGAAVDTAARWLLVRRGPELAGLGIVAIPTGVVRLTRTDGAVNAEVVAQFDAMSCNDVLLPAVTPPAARRGATLTSVKDGPTGRVVWVPSGSMLPTLQHTLLLDMGAAAGVRVGDRVTIYGPNESIVASADIIRADPRSSTAIVVRQSLGSLTTGLLVRVTEKLP